jgi:hypothetical protein
MKKLLVVAAIFGLGAAAGASANFEWDNPYTLFDARKVETNRMRVEWRRVTDVQGVCSAENVRRGYEPIKYSIKACSFNDATNTECIVVTHLTTSMHSLGHEMRHCFQGAWHG